MGNGSHLLIQECTPVISNFNSCFATSSLIGRTALWLSQHPTLTLFHRSCITHIGNNVGLVPLDDIPRMLRSKPSGKKKGEPCGNSTGLSALATSDPLGHFLHQLLQEQGQPKGTLTPTNGSLGEIKFWSSVPPCQSRPCNTARIWRPFPGGAQE